MLAELVRRLVDAYQAASMHQLLDTLVGKFEKRAGVADAHTEFFCQRHRGLPQERLGLGLNVIGPFTRLLGFSHLRDQLLVEVKLRHELRGLARFPGCLQCIPDPAQHLLDAAPLRMNPLDSLRACYPPPRFIEFQFNREGPPRLPPRRHWFHLLKVDRASTKASARPGRAPGRARFFRSRPGPRSSPACTGMVVKHVPHLTRRCAPLWRSSTQPSVFRSRRSSLAFMWLSG